VVKETLHETVVKTGVCLRFGQFGTDLFSFLWRQVRPEKLSGQAFDLLVILGHLVGKQFRCLSLRQRVELVNDSDIKTICFDQCFEVLWSHRGDLLIRKTQHILGKALHFCGREIVHRSKSRGAWRRLLLKSDRAETSLRDRWPWIDTRLDVAVSGCCF